MKIVAELLKPHKIVAGIATFRRATVKALKLNNEIAVEVRRNWTFAGWHPPISDE